METLLRIMARIMSITLIVFIVLKLTGVVDWNWWITFSPLAATVICNCFVLMILRGQRGERTAGIINRLEAYRGKQEGVLRDGGGGDTGFYIVDGAKTSHCLDIFTAPLSSADAERCKREIAGIFGSNNHSCVQVTFRATSDGNIDWNTVEVVKTNVPVTVETDGEGDVDWKTVEEREGE